MPPEYQQKSKAVWVVVIIIALVILAFLVYYFRNQLPVYSPAAETAQTPASDAVNDIEKDLGATNLDNLDQELSDIDKELNTVQ